MNDLYCTVGRGMEPFCVSELSQLGATHLYTKVEGKIFFSLPSTARSPLLLRTVERVFVSAYHDKQTLDTSNKAVAAFQLQRLLAEQVAWSDCLSTWRYYHPEAASGLLPFCINVRLSGKLRNLLQPIRVARSFTQRLCNSKILLKPCLKNPLVAIDLHISDEHITAGIALSLSSQAMGGPSHGLRSTTASAMAKCLYIDSDGQFTDNEVSLHTTILDPMCGKGSLLYELSQFSLIGIDIDKKQLSVAKFNVPKADFLLGNASNLPMNSKSIDSIFCDLPFGLQYSNEMELEYLLPNVIQEMKRVIKPQGRVVLLNSVQQIEHLETCVGLDWRLLNRFKISLGLLETAISVYIVK